MPTFNHPYLDIARSIVQTIGAGFIAPEVSTQFIDGYFSHEKELNLKVLHAAVLFISHTKSKHWHEMNREDILQNIRNYLLKNKYHLD